MTLLLPLMEASGTEDNSRNVAGVSNVFSIISVDYAENSVNVGDLLFIRVILHTLQGKGDLLQFVCFLDNILSAMGFILPQIS